MTPAIDHVLTSLILNDRNPALKFRPGDRQPSEVTL
jgi:hypothetical protein